MAVRLPPNPTDQNTFMDIANGHGYLSSIKYSWEGKECCRNIANALDAWCKAEEAHCAALRKIVKTYSLPVYSETGSTLNTSWEALKLGMLHHGRNAELRAKNLREQEKKFVDFRHSQSKVKRSLEAEMKAANKSLNEAKSNAKKSKQKYFSVCKTAVSTIAKRDTVKDDPKAKEDQKRKLCVKVEKLMRDVEKTDLQYQAQLDTLNLEEISHREKMDRVLQDLQVVEETRIATTKQLLSNVSDNSVEAFSSTLEGWKGVTEGIAAINKQTDIKRFVMKQCSEAMSQGKLLPRLVRTGYEPYESSVLDNEGRTSTRKQNQKTTPDIPPSANARRPPPHPDASASGEKKVNSQVAMSDKKYSKKPPGMDDDDDEDEDCMSAPTRPTRKAPMTPGKGAPVILKSAPPPPLAPPPTFSGPPGMSKNNILASTPSPPLRKDMIWARATFDFPGEEQDDLQFNESDLIQIVDKSDSDWWKGKLNGKGAVGSFPCNYCELIFKDGRMRMGTAKYDFSSDEPGEISFKEGDSIEVISVDDTSGWWEGRCTTGSGEVGLFPSNRVMVKDLQ